MRLHEPKCNETQIQTKITFKNFSLIVRKQLNLLLLFLLFAKKWLIEVKLLNRKE